MNFREFLEENDTSYLTEARKGDADKFMTRLNRDNEKEYGYKMDYKIVSEEYESDRFHVKLLIDGEVNMELIGKETDYNASLIVVVGNRRSIDISGKEASRGLKGLLKKHIRQIYADLHIILVLKGIRDQNI